MPISLQSLIGWRDSLVESRMGGIREVTDQNGERVVYKSDSEMAAALAYAEKRIAEFNRSIPKTIVFNCSKGI